MDWTFWAAILFIVIMLPIGLSQSKTKSVPDSALVARCPNCKSTSITANKQGFGLGKAAVGAVALGPLGLLAGGIGSGNVNLTCLSCGNQWDNNGLSAKMDRDLQKQEIITKQVASQQPVKKYLKQSEYQKILTNMIKGQTNQEVITEMIAASRENLTHQNIFVVPDEEFTRITGQQ